MSADDPLDRPASRAAVEDWHRDGLLGEAARAEALEWLASDREWWPAASRLMAGTGTALLLSGVIFFFAANWTGLSRHEKLGLAAAAWLVAFVAALWRPLDSRAGRLSLLAATVLTGAFLAVFGQVHQTGADAWQLFAAWSALTAGWMLLSRSVAHVVTWVVITQVALATWWTQELLIRHDRFPAGLCLILAAVSFGALFALTGLAERGADWASGEGARRLLLAAGLGTLVLPTCVLLLEPTRASPSSFAAAVAAVAAGAVSWRHHRRRRDLPGLALTSGFALMVALTLVGKPLFEISDEWPAFFFFGLIVTAAVAGAVVVLRREQAAFREGS